MITSGHYYKQEIFSEELNKIFSANWLFVGMENELANNNDFVTIDIAGNAIVVQNFRGVVKAFDNICLHRFTRLQVERRGNRPFFCRYHGWAYLPDGTAVIPSKFADDIPDKECYKLTSYPVDKCGKFIFVNTGDQSLSLFDFLGDYYKILVDISIHFGKEIYSDVMPHKANWKLLVENVLECYHCRTVHKESFLPMGIGFLPAINFRSSSKHNDCEYPKKETEELKLKENKLSFLRHKSLNHDSFHHIYIYPNLFISSTEGNLFYVGSFIPQAVGETILNIKFYAPALNVPEGEKINKFLLDAFNNVAVESALTVLNEDKFVLENIQNVVDKIDRNPIFGIEEFRINKFHDIYFTDINK